jgi:hypothetical protein
MTPQQRVVGSNPSRDRIVNTLRISRPIVVVAAAAIIIIIIISKVGRTYYFRKYFTLKFEGYNIKVCTIAMFLFVYTSKYISFADKIMT